jgi:uncharacterized protein YbjT (DUF2867 family)
MDDEGRAIAVVGATGLQGRAGTRRLLAQGWRIRVLTRDPEGSEPEDSPRSGPRS